MAREHARILTKIWRDDDDWRALPWEAQHMYFLLLSQPTLSHAGTAPLTLHRWSRLTEGRSPGDIEKVLRLLEDRRFVVIDWETEELLIRSFIRNDGVYRQPNVLKSAMRVVLEEVESRRLKDAIAEELLRVGFSEFAARLNPSPNPSGNPSPNPPEGGGETPAEPPADPSQTKDKANPSAKGSFEGSNRLGNESRGRGEGGVVKSRSVVGSVSRSAQTRGTRIPDDFAVTDDMAAWGRREFPHIDGRRQTELFVDHWRAQPGQKGVKVDWVATWRNWIRKADEIAASRPGYLRSVPSPPPATTFEQIRAAGDAQEAARLIGVLWREPARPPSDKTPHAQWLHARAVEFIDLHRDRIEAALTGRKTG